MNAPMKICLASALALATAMPTIAQPYGQDAYQRPPQSQDPNRDQGSPYRPTQQYQDDQARYQRDRADYQDRKDAYDSSRQTYEDKSADYRAARANYERRHSDWLRARTDPAGALDAYVRLCARGGEAPFQDLVASAGLVSPFAPGVLAGVVREAASVLGA